MKDGSKWDESKGDYVDRDPRFDMTIVHHGSVIEDKEGNAITVNVDPNDPKIIRWIRSDAKTEDIPDTFIANIMIQIKRHGLLVPHGSVISIS